MVNSIFHVLVNSSYRFQHLLTFSVVCILHDPIREHSNAVQAAIVLVASTQRLVPETRFCLRDGIKAAKVANVESFTQCLHQDDR